MSEKEKGRMRFCDQRQGPLIIVVHVVSFSMISVYQVCTIVHGLINFDDSML